MIEANLRYKRIASTGTMFGSKLAATSSSRAAIIPIASKYSQPQSNYPGIGAQAQRHIWFTNAAAWRLPQSAGPHPHATMKCAACEGVRRHAGYAITLRFRDLSSTYSRTGACRGFAMGSAQRGDGTGAIMPYRRAARVVVRYSSGIDERMGSSPRE
ncbi:hypothetical protein BD309DRAFT_343773 [Dichomitus squalens]|nr:hypothetical protein BD309DRAFT_343773 [Dichomitus squalens]